MLSSLSIAICATVPLINGNSQLQKRTEESTEAPTEEPTDSQIVAQLKDDIKNKVENSDMSAAVYVVQNGETLYDGGQGMATKEVKNSSEAVYGVASITKQFTAASILQLVADKKIDLNDRLDKFFPKYKHGKEITISQLLSMRSGIPDYYVESVENEIYVKCDGTEDEITIDKESTREENIKAIRNLFLSQDLLFNPGEQFYYSDSNYALLAEIISQVSGMSYHEYIRKNIFEPLDMDTAAFIDDHDYKGLVTIASTDTEEFSFNYYNYGGLEYGCGDLLCSTHDLYKWYKGLFSGKILHAKEFEMMTINHSKEGERGYGYGLSIGNSSPFTVYYHGGHIPSRYSIVYYIPECDYFEASLGNSHDETSQSVASNILDLFLKSKEEPKESTESTEVTEADQSSLDVGTH